MENFLNIAKEGYNIYQNSQNHSNSDVSKTGGQEYNSPYHSGQQGGPGGGHGPSFDHDEVVRTAEQHGAGEASLYTNALGYVNDNRGAHQNPVDENGVQEAHNRAYSQEGGSGMNAHDMGGAAALQVLKKFTSGGSGGGGGSTSQLISLAMAEASKLFDKSGGAASGNKQDAVNGAAMTVMKLLAQSKLSGTMGGNNSGGLSSLMGLASKFM